MPKYAAWFCSINYSLTVLLSFKIKDINLVLIYIIFTNPTKNEDFSIVLLWRTVQKQGV